MMTDLEAFKFACDAAKEERERLDSDGLLCHWREGMEEAPTDGQDILAIVDGARTIIHWGKVSHVPLYGWIDLVCCDVEDRDICHPSHWMPLPPMPEDD